MEKKKKLKPQSDFKKIATRLNGISQIAINPFTGEKVPISTSTEIPPDDILNAIKEARKKPFYLIRVPRLTVKEAEEILAKIPEAVKESLGNMIKDEPRAALERILIAYKITEYVKDFEGKTYFQDLRRSCLISEQEALHHILMEIYQEKEKDLNRMQRIGHYDRWDDLSKLLRDIIKSHPGYTDKEIFQALHIYENGKVIQEIDDYKTIYWRDKHGKEPICSYRAFTMRIRRIKDKLSQ